MADDAPQTEALHLGPGQIWSGRRRYTADGAIVRVTWETSGDQRRCAAFVIQQLHDINTARHRSRREVREHLSRCLRVLLQEGVVFMHDGEPIYAPPAVVSSAREITMHAFHAAEPERGPFCVADRVGHG